MEVFFRFLYRRMPCAFIITVLVKPYKRVEGRRAIEVGLGTRGDSEV